MGFYGNITNVSRTQFQFDKIYPNRKAMEQAMLNDGIYLGRHVLIEYDNDGLDGMKEVVLDDGKYYYGAPNSRTLLTWANTYTDEVIYVKAEPAYIFYKRDSEPSGVDKNTSATFTQFTSGNEDTYGRNYAIDNEIYKSSRGYDSTVWQKVYTDNTERYVMIAELNTVVPKFDIATDAPTMVPVQPHFDTQSTDVYYKLHLQNPWIVRVAEAKGNQQSDAQIEWQEVVYDEKQSVGNQYSVKTVPKAGAIYFNKAAFDSQLNKQGPIDKTVEGDDKIIIDLVSSGLELYDDHDNTTDKPIAAPDIQELTINLPAIGNMMSDAWDIIHGPNRDNARTDTNGSLQGRLDSFDAFYDNQIPVKRATDGTIIGSKINGANNYDADIDLLTLPVGANGTITGFTGDDAWIETKIDTTALKAGDKDSNDDQANNSGISIHHTFHATQNSTSAVDKNNGNSTTGANYKQAHIRSTNSHHNNDDKIDLYVPYVDAKGHVVGHNIETVTLPYGYKTITIGDESASTSDVNAAAGDVVADNTQDTLTINPGNKWIHITADTSNDTVTISHEVNNTSSDEHITDWTKVEANTTIPVITYGYDEAGHYISHHTENYKLPFGYGKIRGDSGSTAATATYDELTFTSDEWLTATVSQDKVTYNHDYPYKENDTVSESNVNGNGDAIVLETLVRDDKGHVIKVNQNTVTLPFGYKTFTGDSGSTSADNTQDSMSVTGDNWINVTVANDAIQLAHKTAVVGSITTATPLKPDFGAVFKFVTYDFDANGHKYGDAIEHEVTIPLPSLASGTGNVVTGLSLTPSAGALTETKANLGTIKLGTYEPGDSAADLTYDITLQQALSRLQNKINNEITNRQTAIEALDMTDAAVDGQYVSAVNETDGIIAVSRQQLPVYTLTSGFGNGTVAFNNTDVAVTGLGSAAYTDSAAYDIAGAANAAEQNAKEYADGLATNYATAEQGAKADSALQLDTEFSIPDGDNGTIAVATIPQLFAYIRDLQAQVNSLQIEVNRLSAFHPVEDNATTEE